MNFLSDIADSIGSLFNKAGSVLSDTGAVIGNEWQAAVSKLKSKATEFIGLFYWLQSKRHIAESDPRLASEYQSVMKRGATVKTAVEKATGGMDWINGKIRAFGVNGLGALPAIPIAVVAAAVAAMTGWLADAYKLRAKIEYLESKGVSGSEGARVLGYGSGIDTGTILPLALAAGAFYWLFVRGEKK